MARVCKTQGCQFRIDGSCFEGVEPPSSCPNLVEDDNFFEEDDELDESSVDDSDGTDNKQQFVGIHLYSGEEFSELDLTSLASRIPLRRIIIIGESESGKTTLLATLFELFQEGSFAGFNFSGSRTIIGFEKKCHDARVESGLVFPATVKTISSVFSYLHLSLCKLDQTERIELAISDIGGERIRDAVSSSAIMKELSSLIGADWLCLLIDGNRYNNPTERNLVLRRAFSFIKKAADEGLVSKETPLAIVLTKVDLLNEASKQTINRLIKEELFSQLTGYVHSIVYFELAVRPNTESTLEMGHGLDQLLKLWCSSRPYSMPFFVQDRTGSNRYFQIYH